MLSILLDIVYTLLAVVGLLGFVQLFDIYKNYREDAKIWPEVAGKTYHQLILPIENERSIEEMEMFFRSIHTMKSNNPLTQLVFEIHSDAGKVLIYLIATTEIFSLVRSSLESRFPGVNFIEIEDPFLKFDKNWTDKHTMFEEFKSADFKYDYDKIDGVDVKADLLPSLSWRTIQNGSNPPTNDPINSLISNLQELKEDEYAIFQLILRAGEIDKTAYKKDFEKVRKELMTNATMDGGNALTEGEKTILSEIQRKLTSVNFSMKLRFGYFTRTKDYQANIPWYFMIKSFLKQFDTPYQGFILFTPYSYGGLPFRKVLHYLNYFEPKKQSVEVMEKPYTTDKDSREKPYLKILDVPGSIEAYYRKRQQYVALMDRQFKYGAGVDFVDVESLACLFHFPTTHEKSNTQTKLQNLANETTSSSPGSYSTPPSNLPF